MTEERSKELKSRAELAFAKEEQADLALEGMLASSALVLTILVLTVFLLMGLLAGLIAGWDAALKVLMFPVLFSPLFYRAYRQRRQRIERSEFEEATRPLPTGPSNEDPVG